MRAYWGRAQQARASRLMKLRLTAPESLGRLQRIWKIVVLLAMCQNQEQNETKDSDVAKSGKSGRGFSI
ncbi:hypothetical protein AJ79_05026 [Helicocarpus griseus UAMH5409]|uniref:Uncharacterized protein n=1 Tax=Helicocarpus griseus UAMH5409 TaxID=1447875 RepID=A0A2B7XHH4_9EURO|nr:hypothetical protein AJ79_05026 [Helicocarpus griseus UAMH5409]